MKAENWNRLIAGDKIIGKCGGNVYTITGPRAEGGYYTTGGDVYTPALYRLHPDTRARLRALDAQPLAVGDTAGEPRRVQAEYVPGQAVETVRCDGTSCLASYIGPAPYERVRHYVVFSGATELAARTDSELRPVAAVPGAVVMDRQTGEYGLLSRHYGDGKVCIVHCGKTTAARISALNYDPARHVVMLLPRKSAEQPAKTPCRRCGSREWNGWNNESGETCGCDICRPGEICCKHGHAMQCDGEGCTRCKQPTLRQSMHPATWPCVKCGRNREIPQGGTCPECAKQPAMPAAPAEQSIAERIDKIVLTPLPDGPHRLVLIKALRALAAVPPDATALAAQNAALAVLEGGK